MKIKFQAQKPNRLRNQFFSLEFDLCNKDWSDWWYYPKNKEWRKVIGDEVLYKEGDTWGQSFCPCRSLKAALRKIKKLNVPKRTVFRLSSKYIGCDVYITV